MPENSSGPADGATTESMPGQGQDISSGDALPGRDLTPEHLELLTGQAIKPEILAQARVRSVVEPGDLPAQADPWWSKELPGILFWYSYGGRTVPQLRPDKPKGDAKYLFPEGSEPPLNRFRDDGGHGPILLVEGTKQTLAAASYADPALAIYGMFGCWGFSGRDLTFAKGRLVYVALDADLATNRKVWEAAKALRDHLADTVKAAGVRFVITPGAGSTGLDDWLATVPEDDRGQALANLLDGAEVTLPKAPAARKKETRNSRYFGEYGRIKPLTVAQDLVAALPMALTRENKVAVYRKGVYRTNDLALKAALVQMLKDDYAHGHLNSVEDTVVSVLELAGHRLPDHIGEPLVNVLNGMVDLRNGEIQEHDPGWLSAVQFPVTYDPAATCPMFDRWAKEIIGEQLPALLEVSSTLLDPTAAPTKAPLLYGPSRSGKGTYQRLLAAIAGPENTSGVSLHELVEDNFARADLYGMSLNIDADVSARHVQDIKWFKYVTGEDLIRGNRKWGGEFFFVNQALFILAANELPTVGEVSRAYVNRIKPFKFAHSFADAEDPSIEQAMKQELPGILNHLIRAWQERKARGHDLDIDPDIQQEFEEGSDRVRLWLGEEMAIVTEVDGKRVIPGTVLPAELCTVPTLLADAFNEWAKDGHSGGMGRRGVMKRLAAIPDVVEVRQARTKTRAFNVVRRGDLDD